MLGLSLSAMRMLRAMLVLCCFLFLMRPHLIVSAFDFSFPPEGEGSFTLQGVASHTNDGVWLTYDPTTTRPAASNQTMGRFVLTQKVQFIDDTRQPSIAASFSTSFAFKIITTDIYGQCGDGLAFFIAPDQLPANSYGEYLGLANGNVSEQPSRHLFAVEFDTFQNFDAKDPSSSHVGIDVDSLISIATNDTSDVSDEYGDDGLFLYSNYTFTAWVDYDAPNGSIEVRMIRGKSNQRPGAPILSTVYNLSTVFKNDMYVGFSAATGAQYEGHILYSWNFSTRGLEITPAPSPTAHSPSRRPAPSSTPQRPPNGRWKVGLGVGLGTFSVVGCILTIFLANWCPKLRLHSERSNEHSIESSLHQYSYRELRRATQEFSNARLLGQGAFSRVYEATDCGPDKSTVAVKRLNRGLGKDSFPAEARIISSIRHRNLLQLVGWCCENGEAMLVYEYMRNGSLDRHLFGQQGGIFLSSDSRFNILLGVAAGLEYLHEGLGECVLHRDIKAANVLLDANLQPHLGDFGLARLIGHDEVATMTAAGTLGYVAPEVQYTGKASDRSDVYGFGILALEVACGRRVMNFQLQPQETNLLAWVWLLHESNKLMDAVDPMMVATTAWGNETQEKWRCVLHTALLCCHPIPDSRPKMQQVHQILKEVRPLALPRSRPNYPYSNVGSASSSSRPRSSSAILLTSGVSSTNSAGRSPPESSLSHPSFSASASASMTLQSDSSHVELQPQSGKPPHFTC